MINLVNIETKLYTKYMGRPGEQDKSDENRSKCQAVGLIFPRPDCTNPKAASHLHVALLMTKADKQYIPTNEIKDPLAVSSYMFVLYMNCICS